MEKQVKKQIDELIEYSKMIKNNYYKLAAYEAIPDKLSRDETEEAKSILAMMDKIIEIEQRKYEQIDISKINMEDLEYYLVKFYEASEPVDFLFKENYVERERVFSRIRYKLMMKCLCENIPIEDGNIANAVYYSINNNYIYAADYQMHLSASKELFANLKYGRIYTLPVYDLSYFHKCMVKPIIPFYECTGFIQGIDKEKMIKMGRKIIDTECSDLINFILKESTNEALQNLPYLYQCINYLIYINACLLSTFDTDYIDQIYTKFLNSKSSSKEFSTANKFLNRIIIRGKKQVIEKNKSA